LLNAGINVALGTDGSASNNNLDLLGEMHTAALIGKTIANDPTATSATTILEMATLGGAKALGLNTDIGSLEVGKAADLIAVNFNHLNTQPVYHPISHLVYACHSSQVSDVWVAGQHLLKQQQLQTIDRAQCIAAAQKWRSRISS
jgi:5-methylthioadenosine/S-adenosylhomocysteine deaminase